MAKIKLKPKARKGVITIKALVKHPMETEKSLSEKIKIFLTCLVHSKNTAWSNKNKILEQNR